MVISPSNRYVFVEIPQTASTAVGNELCECYGGQRILEKHSSYQDFLRFATDEEKQYRVLACVRNPMDVAVSSYFKALTDHRKRYSRAPRGDTLLKRVVNWSTRREVREYEYVYRQANNFPSYFRRFYWWIYNSRVCMLPGEACLLLRFERLNEDFQQALAALGLRKVRDLPVRNPTHARERDFAVYYSLTLRRRAVWVFGPFMEKWGYQFPEDWGVVSVPRTSRILLRLDSTVRSRYFRYLDTRLRGRTLRRTW